MVENWEFVNGNEEIEKLKNQLEQREKELNKKKRKILNGLKERRKKITVNFLEEKMEGVIIKVRGDFFIIEGEKLSLPIKLKDLSSIIAFN